MMQTAAVSIRPYQPSDLDAVITIFERAVREVASKHYTLAQIDAWAHTERKEWRKARLSRPTWIAEMSEEPVGFSDLEEDGHLDMMFVHPAFQGQGVASALLNTVEAAAREQLLTVIYTEASLSARPFFERRGFAVITLQTIKCRGQKLTNFQMRKSLT
jgi:putative acetyltransferase